MSQYVLWLDVAKGKEGVVFLSVVVSPRLRSGLHGRLVFAIREYNRLGVIGKVFRQASFYQGRECFALELLGKKQDVSTLDVRADVNKSEVFKALPKFIFDNDILPTNVDASE